MEGKAGKFEVTGNTLKLLAMITMLVDHVGYGIYYRFYELDNIYTAMRLIGRMAFPLYCFLLVEGFFHTSDFRKYGIRLLILATISEFPFDVAVNLHPSFFDYNNVIFTLLIGLLTIGAIDYIKNDNISWLDSTALQTFAIIGVYALGCLFSFVMHTDYGYTGVTVIVAMYYLYGTDMSHRLLSFGTGVVILVIGCGLRELAAFAMVLPVVFYEGNRGSSNKILRHCFNLFYPVHLAVIAIVVYVLSQAG